MWNKPQLMTAIADLLFVGAAAVLLVAAMIWGTRLPLFPLREVVVTHPLQEVRRSEIERALNGLLRGNFFSVNVDALRQSLEHLPWVRHAEVRRHWPSRIEITIEEHRAAARWGETSTQFVNTFGEVFTASFSTATSAREKRLPHLSGPTGSAAEVLRRYEEFAERLHALGRRPERLFLSQRLAWRVDLDNGIQIELGREQTKAPVSLRLQRFVRYYPMLTNARRTLPSAVDMRYPNGFAVRFAEDNNRTTYETKKK